MNESMMTTTTTTYTVSMVKNHMACDTMATEMSKLRDEGSFCDFNMKVDNELFPCHRVVLAANSPVLKTMFSSTMEEVTNQEVDMSHVGRDIVQVLLDFMYLGKATVCSDLLYNLTHTSEYLQMPRLRSQCLDRALPSITKQNVIAWWVLTERLFHEELHTHCVSVIAHNFLHVTKQEDFLQLSSPEVRSCLQELHPFHMDNDDILDTIMRWVKHDEEERQKSLPVLLLKVDLGLVSVPCLQDHIKNNATLLQDHSGMYYFITTRLLEESLTFVGGEVDVHMNNNDDDAIVSASVGTGMNDICWYLNSSNELEELTRIPTEFSGLYHSICGVPGGFAVTGGQKSDTAATFCVADKTWNKLPRLMSVGRYRHASIYIKGELYILGGFVSGRASNTMDTLSLECGEEEEAKWKQGQALLINTGTPKVASIDERHIYVFDEHYGMLFALNVKTSEWRTCAQLPGPRNFWGGAITAGGGRLFVAGGQLMTYFAYYDPLVDTWCEPKPSLLRHSRAGLVYHRGRLYLGGGGGMDEVEEYNFDADKWRMCKFKLPVNGIRNIQHLMLRTKQSPPCELHKLQ